MRSEPPCAKPALCSRSRRSRPATSASPPAPTTSTRWSQQPRARSAGSRHRPARGHRDYAFGPLPDGCRPAEGTCSAIIRPRPTAAAAEHARTNETEQRCNRSRSRPGPGHATNTGRSAHHQPQDSADLVSRITAAGDTQIRWLTPQALPGLQPRPKGSSRVNHARTSRKALITPHDMHPDSPMPGESLAGFGLNSEGQGCSSQGGACATAGRAIKDGAGYRRGIRIQERRPQRTPHRGLISSRPGWATSSLRAW